MSAGVVSVEWQSCAAAQRGCEFDRAPRAAKSKEKDKKKGDSQYKWARAVCEVSKTAQDM
jgi:hypothetical protein